MTTVDGHHHFWDPSKAEYPWLTGDLEPIRRAFGPRDLAPALAATGIERTVLVQTRSSVEETREFLATAARHPFIAGVVGWVDLTAPSVGDDISALRAGPGGDRLVGIRHQVQDELDREWLSRADVRRGLRAVGSAGLAYDLLVRPRELPAAVALVGALPDVRFVLDHAAKPPIASGDIAPWATHVRRLAAHDNATCKLSGLVTEADWTAWTPGDLQPCADVVLEAFGPARVMFGSDWPVCLLAASYARVVEVVRQLTLALTPTERDQVFGGTAVAAYGLRAA